MYGEPSFEKFVKVIIEGYQTCHEGPCQSMDEHWRPYFAACSYCNLKYDFISKVKCKISCNLNSSDNKNI